MKKRFALLKALSWYEWRLLFCAILLLPLTALTLHLFGFKRTQIFMSRFLHADRSVNLPEVNSLQEASVVARMVGVAARHGVYRANCLKQSLVLWWLLARCGILAEIKIGVQKGNTEHFAAHAWVECYGLSLDEPEDVWQRFSTFRLS